MDGGVPGDLGRRGCSWSDIVYCRDVAAIETYAWPVLEHVLIGWVD